MRVSRINTNIYGLPRRIDEMTKLIVRQNSGFGCVICGALFCDYEHVDPEFKNAKNHDPNKITLLCGRCHDNVTKGIWSKEKVKEAMVNPENLKKGSSSKLPLDLSGAHFPEIFFGETRFGECNVPISIYGQQILKIEQPINKGEPFLLSGVFTNDKGIKVLEIERNDLIVSSNSWDIKTSGTSIQIRNGKRDIVLDILFEARGNIFIKKMKGVYFNQKVTIDRNGLIIAPNIPGSTAGIRIQGGSFTNGKYGINIIG